jgi:hypothetical protein
MLERLQADLSGLFIDDPEDPPNNVTRLRDVVDVAAKVAASGTLL